MERKWTIPIFVAIVLLGLLIAVIASQRQPQRVTVVTPTHTTPLRTIAPTPALTPTSVPTATSPSPAPGQSSNIIRVTSPLPNQIISSPLTLRGQARGSWFFEATAPVRLLDANGRNLAQGFITAEGDWMTTNFVPFTGTISFSSPSTDNGQLIMEKSNPSGLPENDEQITIPVRFR